VSAAGTEISAKDGIVTLRGKASSQAQKDLTTEYAKDLDGVKDVENKMTVAMKPGEKAMGEKVDTVIESIDDHGIIEAHLIRLSIILEA
jgi:hyperosmotically inducible protein